MLDAALAGDAPEALVQLDRLLVSGEVPIALLAQISASLRRFAAAARLVEQAERRRRTVPLRQALEQAGVKPFVLGKAEEQLRKLGRARAMQLYRWLLEADLALKGASSSPTRCAAGARGIDCAACIAAGCSLLQRRPRARCASLPR